MNRYGYRYPHDRLERLERRTRALGIGAIALTIATLGLYADRLIAAGEPPIGTGIREVILDETPGKHTGDLLRTEDDR